MKKRKSSRIGETSRIMRIRKPMETRVAALIESKGVVCSNRRAKVSVEQRQALMFSQVARVNRLLKVKRAAATRRKKRMSLKIMVSLSMLCWSNKVAL
jgi:hypothetical protein